MVYTVFDIETTGLNPCVDKILTIQVKRGDEINLWKLWEEENEVIMVQEFLNFLQSISRNESIYGYNCLKFDVLFIWTRLSIHEAKDCENYRNLYEKKWKDLYQYLGGNFISMDRWLKAFGIVRQCQFKGRDVPSLYAEKRFQEIEEHAIDDLIVCEKLAKRARALNVFDRPHLGR